jgi:CheY-like chemotaxis protein/anti-sigma regulatory factor (Ser/Thr protein kinase)
MRLRQVLLNLLSNACKFTEKGTVTLSVARAARNGSGGIAIAVTDSGIGMTPEQMAKLFTEFTQAEARTSRKYGGTGLGLAISKRLVEMMGGSVAVESEPGKGSTFKVWLPESRGTEADPQSAESAAASAPAASASSAPTVLVIDDDADARDLMRRFLAREGFDTLTAADGSEGLRLARQFRPNLITLDVMMPRMDGWAVLKELQADPGLATIPVVMLSILDEQEKGFALGAADYLIKPFNRERLRAILLRHRRVGTGGRVLIVEDDDATRALLREMLIKEGWTVDLAEDGLAAMARVEVETPDLILLDLMMPRMDGFQFLEAMRASASRARLRRCCANHFTAERSSSPRSGAFLRLRQSRPERSAPMAKILYVEDNEDNVYMLRRRLAKHGYEVIVAVDGAKGVEAAIREKPDLILMDLGLPVLSGWEAAQQLKGSAETKLIPIIALSAHALEGEREKALAAGCDEFETKPVDLERLLEKLARLIAADASASSRSSASPGPRSCP